jgi:hypothetical protein
MSIETIILFLAFAVISGASTWLQKRRQAKEEEEGTDGYPEGLPPPLARSQSRGPVESDPTTPQPRPARAVSSWEEELRRLLEGQPRAKPGEAERPVAPPPLPRVSTPSAPTTTPRRITVPSAPASAGERQRHQQPVSSLEESKRSYAEAQRIHQQAQARLQQVTAQTRRHLARQDPMPQSTSYSHDIRAARELLSSPRSARQAVITSLILGSPKALAMEDAPRGLPQAPRL